MPFAKTGQCTFPIHLFTRSFRITIAAAYHTKAVLTTKPCRITGTAIAFDAQTLSQTKAYSYGYPSPPVCFVDKDELIHNIITNTMRIYRPLLLFYYSWISVHFTQNNMESHVVGTGAFEGYFCICQPRRVGASKRLDGRPEKNVARRTQWKWNFHSTMFLSNR